jgi:MscS family membrane protein
MTNARRFWTATTAAALVLAPLALAAIVPGAFAPAPADSVAPAQAEAPAVPQSAVALWLREQLPASFREVRPLGLEMWQWLGLALAAALAIAVGHLGARLVTLVVRRIVRRTKATWDDVFLEMEVGPSHLAIVVLVFFFGAKLLALAPTAQHFIASACKAAMVVAVTWFALRAIDIVNRILHASGHAGRGATVSLMPMARRAMKAFVLAIAIVTLLQNVGFNVTGLVAGLGVGGLAIALAAQKTLENLFGGLSILIDKPVKVGDLCTIGSHSGVVEEIGSRSTRLRTSARTLVAIPNSEFSTARIENFAARDYTVMQTILPLASDTSPEQLHRVLGEIRSALEAHPMVAENPCRVTLVHIGPYSYDIEVSAGIRTTSQEAFIEHRGDVFLKIIDIVAACGARFAAVPQALSAGAPPSAEKPGSERKP